MATSGLLPSSNRSSRCARKNAALCRHPIANTIVELHAGSNLQKQLFPAAPCVLNEPCDVSAQMRSKSGDWRRAMAAFERFILQMTHRNGHQGSTTANKEFSPVQTSVQSRLPLHPLRWHGTPPPSKDNNGHNTALPNELHLQGGGRVGCISLECYNTGQVQEDYHELTSPSPVGIHLPVWEAPVEDMQQRVCRGSFAAEPTYSETHRSLLESSPPSAIRSTERHRRPAVSSSTTGSCCSLKVHHGSESAGTTGCAGSDSARGSDISHGSSGSISSSSGEGTPDSGCHMESGKQAFFQTISSRVMDPVETRKGPDDRDQAVLCTEGAQNWTVPGNTHHPLRDRDLPSRNHDLLCSAGARWRSSSIPSTDHQLQSTPSQQSKRTRSKRNIPWDTGKSAENSYTFDKLDDRASNSGESQLKLTPQLLPWDVQTRWAPQQSQLVAEQCSFSQEWAEGWDPNRNPNLWGPRDRKGFAGGMRPFTGPLQKSSARYPLSNRSCRSQAEAQPSNSSKSKLIRLKEDFEVLRPRTSTERSVLMPEPASASGRVIDGRVCAEIRIAMSMSGSAMLTAKTRRLASKADTWKAKGREERAVAHSMR
ncbi:hypothetical protein CBR_g40657 [Chara braunii]|uniref:Uncharacterized protein n=1 Tax=Chara braunii TaxID=69332 RepID=A0A388LU55_CHABU|nr:hypothetical protein CBR_g40657 [Chara braunii]|eukprot:GBG85847.1 hypothetical protein CBR_g40657 [Chara braunii]